MILVDTGVLLSAVSSTDRHHQKSADLLAAHAGQLVTPAPVIAETAWLIESVVGPAAEAAFVTSAANGELGIEDLDANDYRRCAELIERYADLGLGLVDASVVAIAERLNLTVVATLNHRDFNVVRPKHCAAFELLP
ncbi:MAG: PIN domain-containing protein [Acidimicrobiales bacterium]